MSKISVKLVEPFPAWAKLYAKMTRQFARGYDGDVKSVGEKVKHQEQIALDDIKKTYIFFIELANKKIGYICAPTQTDADTGEIAGRYIDTRFILPEYRGKGYGTQAFKELSKISLINSVKLNYRHLYLNWKYWQGLGFTNGVMAGLIDVNYKAELDGYKQYGDQLDPSYFHWYLLNDLSPELVQLKNKKYPLFKTSDLFNQQKKVA